MNPSIQRRTLLAASAAAAATGFLPSAFAQTSWPTKPVTVIVPFAPGGAGNGSVRILADIIGPTLGQPLVVENRAGGGGIPGTQYVTNSKDDHMLLMGSTSMTILPALRNDLGYDVQKDLQAVGMISSQPVVFAVPASSPIKSLDDLVARAKSGDVTTGNSGVGTLSHLTTELLNRKLGLKLMAVPYKGDAQLIPDVVAGTIQMAVMNLPVALPLIKDGRLRAVTVTSKAPVASLPGVKTLNTLGPEFVISGWAALFAARNVPAAGVERFATQLRAALQQESVRERFDGFGVTPEIATPAQTREYVAAEMARWADVVKSRGIKLE
ncbi:Bug family tripartite tricarboxylate transporter substrate binding protein [Hydrogenophaga sp. BPS33]|uniref:Bug family tripartite tricarboxylate transporter substrate binding protein n=1 Tax=Hydrogenophaga sp. BPS33 TaxID=2651974 RepID=UPI00131FD453|nr:tripartite tricarboxylate transporter substrate binding protein [Hydrogenophaga sp. BPS33]QHE86909.1 tripartite tricarboxylate transporter substrate binding protein [Hydrogenophaga sp. BPS33]